MIAGGGAVVESKVPGRVRFRLPKGRRREDVMTEVTSVFSGADGVIDVTGNSTTGSVLVRYDPRVVRGDDLVKLGREANIVSDIVEDVEELLGVSWPAMSDAAGSVLRTFRRFDQTVSRMTGGAIDGKMLVILLLFSASLWRALFWRRQVPTPWHALLWYSYSVFMQWHNPRARRH